MDYIIVKLIKICDDMEKHFCNCCKKEINDYDEDNNKIDLKDGYYASARRRSYFHGMSCDEICVNNVLRSSIGN